MVPGVIVDTSRHIGETILVLLDTIHNRPPGIWHERFTGPPEFFPGGFRLEWWISDVGPLLTTALALLGDFPALRGRHTVPQVQRKILDIVKRHLRLFHWEPFISIAQGALITLRECATPAAQQTIVSTLIT